MQSYCTVHTWTHSKYESGFIYVVCSIQVFLNLDSCQLQLNSLSHGGVLHGIRTILCLNSLPDNCSSSMICLPIVHIGQLFANNLFAWFFNHRTFFHMANHLIFMLGYVIDQVTIINSNLKRKSSDDWTCYSSLMKKSK